MSPQEKKEREVQIDQLVDKLLTAVEGDPHRYVIDALLTALVIVADQHRCCTLKASRAALLAAEHLREMAKQNAAETRPDGVPLH